MNKESFFNLLRNCWLAKCDDHPHSVLYIHDPQYIKELKLCRVLDKSTPKPPQDGKILLEVFMKFDPWQIFTSIDTLNMVDNNYHIATNHITEWTGMNVIGGSSDVNIERLLAVYESESPIQLV